jgi:predicted GNAT family acetyltransferase
MDPPGFILFFFGIVKRQMMEMTKVESEFGGKLIAMDQGEEIGKVIYTWEEPAILVIQHTLVNPRYKGKNIGTQLIFEVADYARKENLKIIPQCPFAEKVFQKNKEIEDVLLR